MNSAEPFGADCKMEIQRHLPKKRLFCLFVFSAALAFESALVTTGAPPVGRQSKTSLPGHSGPVFFFFLNSPAHKIRFDDSTPTRRGASTGGIIHGSRSLPAWMASLR